jgi:hypothetical protein
MVGTEQLLRDARIRRALRFVPEGARVLDVGDPDAVLLRRLGPRLGEGVGIDPAFGLRADFGGYRLMPGAFPDFDLDTPPFDVVHLSRALDDVPDGALARWAAACRRHVVPGGVVIAGVPVSRVDAVAEAFRAAGFGLVARDRVALGRRRTLVFRLRSD